MPQMASLISKSHIKKLGNNQHTELPKCNYSDKTNSPLKEKRQFECIVYKIEVYGRRHNDNNVDRNVKKVYVGSTQGPLKKHYNHRSSFAHEVYRYHIYQPLRWGRI